MDNIYEAVRELADKHFGEYKIRHGQVIPRYCPICHGGNNMDEETFAVGLHNGAYNCKRGSCPGINGNREGSYKQLCDFFGESAFEFSALPRTFIKTAKKVYKKPETEILPITDEIIEYFATRCISKETLDDFKIGSDKNGNIVFPFYRNNELVFVKMRQPKKWKLIEKEYEDRKAAYEKIKDTLSKEEQEKRRPKKPSKEWMDSGTEPILFGMDNVSFNKPLLITEGQIDALALYEAGIHNVVSVPMGCENMDWINLCWDWLENFNEIILFGDSDAPGMEMTSTLMNRLGEYRCMIPAEYPEFKFNGKSFNRICKDANEILLCYGPEGLRELVEACEPAPIKGIIDVSTIQYINPASIPRIMTKIPMLDTAIGGFEEGGVTILSGKRGCGKSTIGSGFLLAAIEQGYKCAAYSGELNQQRFHDWIMLPAAEAQYITYVTDPRSGKRIAMVPPEIQERINNWLAGKMYLYDNGCVFDEDATVSVLRCFEMCVKRYGCKLFLIDNLMCLLTTADEENKAQARFMAKVKAFASKYKVHVIVVAHPRKEEANKKFTSDSVSGSSVINFSHLNK